MAIFPKVQSPCPYKGDLSAIMDGDVCRLCKREVFDLTAMSDAERVTFMRGCTGQVCVSYKFRVRPALAAAAIVAAAIVPTAAAACEDTEIIVMGGISDPAHVEYVQDASDSAIPQLPVVYETAANNSNDASGANPSSAAQPSP